jgi:hypothetical protein
MGLALGQSAKPLYKAKMTVCFARNGRWVLNTSTCHHFLFAHILFHFPYDVFQTLGQILVELQDIK